MKIINWILVALLGFGGGYFTMNYLTANSVQRFPYLIMTLLCVGFLAVLILSRFKKLQMVFAIVLAVAFFAAGYLV